MSVDSQRCIEYQARGLRWWQPIVDGSSQELINYWIDVHTDWWRVVHPDEPITATVVDDPDFVPGQDRVLKPVTPVDREEVLH